MPAPNSRHVKNGCPAFAQSANQDSSIVAVGLKEPLSPRVAAACGFAGAAKPLTTAALPFATLHVSGPIPRTLKSRLRRR
jgi:hypothetical protein